MLLLPGTSVVHKRMHLTVMLIKAVLQILCLLNSGYPSRYLERCHFCAASLRKWKGMRPFLAMRLL